MTRKSKIVTLSILGIIAGLGLCTCCCSGIMEEPGPDDPDNKKGDGPGGGRHVRYSHRWVPIPIFFGGGGAYRPGPSHPGTSSTPRGGFGSTGSSGSSHGGGGSVGG